METAATQIHPFVLKQEFRTGAVNPPNLKKKKSVRLDIDVTLPILRY